MKSRQEHWDTLFSDTKETQLGWYEDNPTQTLELLDHIPKWKEATIFLPGAGTSILVDELLSQEVCLILNDISRVALNQVKERVGDRGEEIIWLEQDIAQPLPTSQLPPVDIWIDRAVLHFLTAEVEIRRYFENVISILKKDGYALFAEYSKRGVTECAGLTVHRYSAEELSERLGASFKLISHFDYLYTTPHGDSRPYIYTLYKREE